MKLTQQKASISGLLLAVSFLALMSLAPLSAVLGTTAYSHSSWTWNPSYTHSHRSGSWTWSGTWSRSGSWTRTWSWSRTWSGTWSRSWTWSRTWTWRTHSYPTYTSTEYIFLPMPCDPNNPYSPCYSPAAPCNPYDPLSPCYVQPTTIISYSPPTQTIVVTESPIQTALVTQTFPPTIQPPDFALSVYPSTVSLPPGVFVGSTDFTLNLTSIQGWRGGIDFTTSSLPPGITFSNLPSQFSLSSPIASWDVQVNIGASAQAGSYAILIVASSGTLAHSTWLTVEVT